MCIALMYYSVRIRSSPCGTNRSAAEVPGLFQSCHDSPPAVTRRKNSGFPLPDPTAAGHSERTLEGSIISDSRLGPRPCLCPDRIHDIRSPVSTFSSLCARTDELSSVYHIGRSTHDRENEAQICLAQCYSSPPMLSERHFLAIRPFWGRREHAALEAEIG